MISSLHFLFINIMMKKTLFDQLFEYAQKNGLPEKDILYAKELYHNHELGLALDHIIVQTYELNIAIDHSFYKLIEKITKKLKLTSSTYEYLLDLIQ